MFWTAWQSFEDVQVLSQRDPLTVECHAGIPAAARIPPTDAVQPQGLVEEFQDIVILGNVALVMSLRSMSRTRFSKSTLTIASSAGEP